MKPEKMGRPKSENPRDKSLNLRLRQDELNEIENCAEKLKKTRTDTIMHGVYLIKESLKNK